MKVKTIVISLLIILLFGQTTYAAVEIVPSKNGQGTDAIVNTTVSNSYSLCRNMTYAGESLSSATVIPHLATNKDWGAVSYLANSVYGTESKGENNGIEIVLDKEGNLAEEGNGVKYYSTNGNATGVMNWGRNPMKSMYTQTSSLMQTYADNLDAEEVADKTNLIELINNKDTEFVEIIDTSNTSTTYTTGMAMLETKNLYGAMNYYLNNSIKYPVTFRQGFFGFFVGSNWPGYSYSDFENRSSGAAFSNLTFRPVIWNK